MKGLVGGLYRWEACAWGPGPLPPLNLALVHSKTIVHIKFHLPFLPIYLTISCSVILIIIVNCINFVSSANFEIIAVSLTPILRSLM